MSCLDAAYGFSIYTDVARSNALLNEGCHYFNADHLSGQADLLTTQAPHSSIHVHPKGYPAPENHCPP